MSEENKMLEQQPEQQRLSDAQLKKERNVANNANAVNAALEAGKNKNAYLAAAHKINKATDGKLGELGGKALNTANKFAPGGRMTQKALNKMGENGTTDRIGQALSKKNSNAPTKGSVGGQSAATVKDKDSSFFSKKEVQEQTSDGGGVSFQATAKFLKIGLIAFAPVMVVVIFMNLIVAGSQTYLKVIGIGQADEVSSQTAEDAIREHASEDVLNQEVDPEDPNGEVGDLTSENEETGYIYPDEFIEDNIYKQKFGEMNFIATVRDREYNEADLNELKDYYSEISSYENGNYDMDTVYNFFFKLLYIQRHYRNSYKVQLDMPLLMATLTVKSSDMSDVFVSNTKGYRVNSLWNGKKENNKYFKYDHDWSNQKISKNDSSHDIEVLVQHMVSKVPYVEQEHTCSINRVVDGEWCYVVDYDKYNEFLKEFLEKKYFINSEEPPKEEPPKEEPPKEEPPKEEPPKEESSNGTNPMATEMIRIALSEYKNRNDANVELYYSKAAGYNYRIPWCAAFVWYVSANTKYNGKSLYPDIISFKTESTGKYMQNFNNSNQENINFYYNDNCKRLAGKNNSDIKYTPKPGDYIFFDWQNTFKRLGDGTQDHTAMVEKYENGKVYTIEGNSGGKIARLSYKISDCRIIGFGSWY